jgi:hypothetical protein
MWRGRLGLGTALDWTTTSSNGGSGGGGGGGSGIRVVLVYSAQTRGTQRNVTNNPVILKAQDLLVALTFVARLLASLAGKLPLVASGPSETTGMAASAG